MQLQFHRKLLLQNTTSFDINVHYAFECRWLQQMPMAQQQAASQAPLGAVPGTGPALANNNLLSSLAGAVPGKLTSSLQKEAGRLPDKKGTAG
jgi:hypothetical protein